MENKLRQDLIDNRITTLVGKDTYGNPKIYLLSAPEGTVAPYVEYQIVQDSVELFSEGNDDISKHEIQIDLFTKGNYTQIRDAIKEVMKEKDYTKGIGGSLYEKDTKLYHYILRYEKGAE